LVGVAISLSLLPPAVNAGVCWAYALMLHTDYVDRNENDDTDYVDTGIISFALTIINIICIWLAGTFTFWMKEVAPIKKQDAFWSRDVIIAREQQSNNLGKEGKAVTTINAGLVAANDLKQQRKRVQFPEHDQSQQAKSTGIRPIESLRPRRYSESHLPIANDSRMDELVRARDVLFDNDLTLRELSDREEVPELPEDFSVDQRLFFRGFMGSQF